MHFTPFHSVYPSLKCFGHLYAVRFGLGMQQPGCRRVCIADLKHRRLLLVIDSHCELISGGKRVAFGREYHVGRRARNCQKAFLGVKIRHGAEQRPGIRMGRLEEYLFAGARFHYLACIHNIYTVCHIGHNAQIMGDEDNGQTSAWYVFSSLGFYPVCPGSNEYVMGAPYFKKATITLENGKKLEISAPKNSDANRYIRSLNYNGKNYTKNYLNHFDLLKGGRLVFDMDNKPNKGRGINESDFPYSFSRDNK